MSVRHASPPPPETIVAILVRLHAKVERGAEMMAALQDIGARSRPAVGSALYRAIPWGWRLWNGSSRKSLREHDLSAWRSQRNRDDVLALIDRAIKKAAGR